MIRHARHRRPRSRRRGHTLIEVVVASTLFVVFTAGLYGGLALIR